MFRVVTGCLSISEVVSHSAVIGSIFRPVDMRWPMVVDLESHNCSNWLKCVSGDIKPN